MPLTNCKIYLELKWSEDCLMSTIADTTFKITKTKLYVLSVTLASKDNVNLYILLEEGFKRPTITILQDFFLMLLFKRLENCLFLHLKTILLMFLIIQ